MIVLDKNGKRLLPEDKIRCHFTEEPPKDGVVGALLDSPTVNEPGYWVDVDLGCGLEGMPSYILEKLPD